MKRDVCTDPSWLRNVTHALLVCTFCPTPRLGTTITPRAGSYEQLSAEYTDPYTLTLADIGSKAPSAAGLIGRPSRLPTKKGCGAGACPACAAGVCPAGA